VPGVSEEPGFIGADGVEQANHLVAVPDRAAVVLAEAGQLEGVDSTHQPADQHRLLGRRQVDAGLPADERLEQQELVVADLREWL
jgi:hypothetical protein